MILKRRGTKVVQCKDGTFSTAKNRPCESRGGIMDKTRYNVKIGGIIEDIRTPLTPCKDGTFSTAMRRPCDTHGGVKRFKRKEYFATIGGFGLSQYGIMGATPGTILGNNDLYSVEDILGLELYAAKPVTIRTAASENADIIRTVPAGGRIGRVYSYLQRGGNTWWMIEIPGSVGILAPDVTAFVKHDQNAFDLDALRQQGATNVAEQLAAEAEANKPPIDKITDALQPLGTAFKWGSAAVIATLIYKAVN